MSWLVIDKLIIGTLLTWFVVLVRRLVEGRGDLVLLAKVTLGVWVIGSIAAWLL